MKIRLLGTIEELNFSLDVLYDVFDVVDTTSMNESANASDLYRVVLDVNVHPSDSCQNPVS